MDRNNNNEVELYSCFGAEWQRWEMSENNRITNALNGQCLDIRDGNDYPDVYVSQCDDSSNSQGWEFQDAPPPPIEDGKNIGKDTIVIQNEYLVYKSLFDF